MKKFAIGASLVALVAVPALAWQATPEATGKRFDQPQTRAPVEASVKEHFAKMDANKDGAVTEAEITAARDARMTERANQRFAMLDTDKSGQISRAEIAAFRQAHKAQRN